MAKVHWSVADLHCGDKVQVYGIGGADCPLTALVDHLDTHGRPFVVFLSRYVCARYLGDEKVSVVERAPRCGTFRDHFGEVRNGREGA